MKIAERMRSFTVRLRLSRGAMLLLAGFFAGGLISPTLILLLSSAELDDFSVLRWLGQEAAEEETFQHEVGKLHVEYVGLHPGTSYRYRTWPYHDDWNGEPFEGTLLANQEGAVQAVWEDVNRYELRLSPGSADWPSWHNLADLADSDRTGVPALGIDRDIPVEMRPEGVSDAVIQAYFVTHEKDFSTVFSVWPDWKFQLMGPNDNGWRPVHTIRRHELELAYSEVNLLCLSASDCIVRSEDPHVLARQACVMPGRV